MEARKDNKIKSILLDEEKPEDDGPVKLLSKALHRPVFYKSTMTAVKYTRWLVKNH